MSARRTRLAVAAAAVVGALHALAYTPFVAPVVKDSETYVAAANALLDGHYSTPLHAATLYENDDEAADLTDRPLPRETWNALERQTLRTPGYPLFLAALGGGDGALSRGLVVVVQSLLTGAAVLLVGLALIPAAGAPVGIGAAWLFALDPFSKRHASLVLTESLAAFGVALVFFLFVRAWRVPSAGRWAAAGTAAGALTLVRPAFSLLCVLVAVAALLRRRPVAALAAAAAAAVVLAPWLAFTASVHGRPVLASISQGSSMLFAAHGSGPDRSYFDIVEDPAYLREARAPHRYAPSAAQMVADPEAHPRYLRRADLEYQQLARERYLDRLSSEPLTVAREYVYRASMLWHAHNDWPELTRVARPLFRIADWLTLAAAAVGAVALVRRGGGPGRALVAYLLVYTLASAVFHTEARYGMPLRGLVLALAAGGIAALAPVSARVGTRATRL